MERPETQYARCGDVHIAYQVVGDAPISVVFAMGIPLSIDSLWDAPLAVRFFRRLTSFARIVLFDRRGVGLSDPITASAPPTLEQWMEDALTVLDDARCDRVALLGSDIHGGQVCMLLAATHPSRFTAAVIVNSAARLLPPSEDEVSLTGLPTPPAEVNRAEWLASAESFALLAPSLAFDEESRDWWRRSILRSISPGVARALVEVRDNSDVSSILSAINVPTLVVARGENRAYSPEYSRYLAAHISSARFIEIEGADQLVFAGDQASLLDEVQEFLTGARPVPELDRVLATVLFTDIVRSTERASEFGDKKWSQLLSEHDAVVSRELERHRGRLVNHTGDGVLATFDGPARAVRCAQSICGAVRPLGVDVRAGVHVGEVELRGDDIGGIAVHIGQRVSSLAGPGEVLVSRTLTDLVAGSGLEFEERGEYELKGVPGRTSVFAVQP